MNDSKSWSGTPALATTGAIGYPAVCRLDLAKVGSRPPFFVLGYREDPVGPVRARLSDAGDRLVSGIRRIAEALSTPAGVEVVEVSLRRAGRFTSLRVDLDRPGTPGVTLDDCRRFSEALGAALDESDLMEFSYRLEVSSPGLDRPIQTDDDVRRNTGRRIQVETTEPVEGKRRFRGVLLGLQGDALRVAVDGEEEVLLPRHLVGIAHQEIEIEPGRGGRPRRRDRGGRRSV